MTSPQTSRSPRRDRAFQPIVTALLRDIDNGRYGIGDRLPTEADLCRHFAVSRFTVRAALALLEQRGVVKRRPKIGTVVSATAPKADYAVAVGSLSELLAFLDSTLVTPLKIEEISADKATARDLGCATGESWVRVQTVRTQAGHDAPISLTDYYLRPRFKAIVREIGKRAGPVYPLLEKKYKVAIATIEQDIGACLLSAAAARTLSAKAKSAALRVIHRMVSAGDGPLYCTISVYPAERFRYVQALKRSQ